jgi:quinoprotein glucose dehydrogenase
MNKALSRRTFLLAGASGLAMPGVAFARAKAGKPRGPAADALRTDWPAYGGLNSSAKYSPLAQIDRTNAAQLQVVWEWESPDRDIIAAHPDLRPGEFQVTPIMVDDVLYVATAMSQAAAIDARTGRTIWVYNPEAWTNGKPSTKGFQHRGVAYWADGDDRRIFLATCDARLIALDAATGTPIADFGTNGEIDLRRVGLQRPVPMKPSVLYGCFGPPLIARNMVVVGGYIDDQPVLPIMPPGDVRGFDARTGALRWTFHTVPVKGEFGYDSWRDGSAERNGNANIWAPMSADEELGLVYLPGTCATDNVYGGRRPGDNLFANSLIALDIETGKRRWHYQCVHHDLWDYDLPCAPNLVDIIVDGKPIKAVAQATKQGYLFVFDRTNGKPVWPIEERPVPQSELATEHSAPTQPHPTWPPPFESQGMSEDLLVDFTPEIKEEAKRILSRYRYGPLYTPVGRTPTLIHPTWTGGANWQGAAVDPETGILYVTSHSSVSQLALDDNGKLATAGPVNTEIAGAAGVVNGPAGLPLIKPPYSRITAIDLNTGQHLWMRPNGPGATDDPRFAPFKLGWIGSEQRTAPLATKTLLFVGEGPHDPRHAKKVLRAYDKLTGELVAETPLPGHVLGAPMTYSIDGQQRIVYAMGFRVWPHKLVALGLGG